MTVTLGALLLVALAVVTVVITLASPHRQPRHREEPVWAETLRTLYELNRLAFDARFAIRDLRRARRRS